MSAPYGYAPSPPPSAPPFPWQEQQQQQQQQPPPPQLPQQGEDQRPAMAYPYHRASSSSSSAPPFSSHPYMAPPWSSYLPPSTPPLPSPYAPAPAPAPASSSFPPAAADPEIVQAFRCADCDASGFIDENDLHRTLSTSHFLSLRTSRLLLHMFCSKDSPMLGLKEFATLWKALKDWKAIFERFDRDRSGSIDESEMREALLSLGYSVSPPILDCLLQKYDRTGQAKAMDYDSFIQSGLIVKGLTEKFKEQDVQLKGSALLSYQTFMLMVLPFIVA